MYGDSQDHLTNYIALQKPSLAGQLAKAMGLDNLNPGWVFYGSVVYGALRPESDLDVLILLDSLQGGPRRLSLVSTDGREVSAYVLTPAMLEADGMVSAYGGYFIGKLANPYFCNDLRPETFQGFHKAMGKFLGRRAYQARACKELPLACLTADQVVADCLLGFISLCPWVVYYLARYHGKPKVWDFFRQTYPAALQAAGVATFENEFYSYRPLEAESMTPYFDELTKARFWALGAKFHPSVESFPDTYIEKAKKSADALGVSAGIEDMLRSLAATQRHPHQA